MAKALRVGIVGTGFAGNFHVDSLRRVYGVDVEIAGVTSRREESRRAFGEKYGIPVFDDMSAMLPHIDVVDLCTPPSLHADGIIEAARAGVHVICEKPLSGYFGPADCGPQYRGDLDAKEPMLNAVRRQLEELTQTVRDAGVIFGYAENFVYAPVIRKEREIVAKTGAQILRMLGEESHNGSGSDLYGIWRYQGGGSLIAKGCHPLSAMLYLKRVEGITRLGRPIRPQTVTGRCERLTSIEGYDDRKFIRTEYHDTEDHGWMHVVFDDGTVGDVIAGEIVLGGIYDYVEVFANNHRTRCEMSPVRMAHTFNPSGPQYDDVYTVEKISTKEGWTEISADEHFTMGYIDEAQDFLACMAAGEEPQSNLDLACDTILTIYAAYLSDERKGRETEVPVI